MTCLLLWSHVSPISMRNHVSKQHSCGFSFCNWAMTSDGLHINHIMFYLCCVNLNYRIGIWPYLFCHSSINYNLRQENEAYLMFTLRNTRAFFQIIPFPQDSGHIFTRNWWHVGVQGFVEEHWSKPPAHYQSQAASRSCVWLVAFLCRSRVSRSEKGSFLKAKHLPAKHINVWLKET